MPSSNSVENSDNLENSVCDGEVVQEVTSYQPPIKKYCDAVLSSIMAHGGLHLNSAEIVVNLFNNVNQRFSSDPILLPNLKYFWRKRSKANPVSVYLICEYGHAHGPFEGEPKDYGVYQCENRTIPASIRDENTFYILI